METGKKFDEEKPMVNLVDPWFYEDIAKVLTYGAQKYDANNWQTISSFRYVAALERHMIAYKKGETHDPESGLSHMAHVAVNAMFLHYFTRQKYETTNV